MPRPGSRVPCPNDRSGGESRFPPVYKKPPDIFFGRLFYWDFEIESIAPVTPHYRILWRPFMVYAPSGLKPLCASPFPIPCLPLGRQAAGRDLHSSVFQIPKLSAIEIVKSLNQFFPRVHNKRTVRCDWLADRFTA